MANHTWRSENGTCEIHLTCSVENMNDDNLVRWEVAGSISIREANLTLSWDPKNSSEKKYTCIAENPVSQLSFSVSTQSLCKGNSRSQVSPRALSNCGMWYVSPAQGDFPKQGLRGRPPNTAGVGLTPPRSSVPLIASRGLSSLPPPSPPAHSGPRGQVLGKSELLPTPALPGSCPVHHRDSHSQKGCPEPEPTQPPKVA